MAHDVHRGKWELFCFDFAGGEFRKSSTGVSNNYTANRTVCTLCTNFICLFDSDGKVLLCTLAVGGGGSHTIFSVCSFRGSSYMMRRIVCWDTHTHTLNGFFTVAFARCNPTRCLLSLCLCIERWKWGRHRLMCRVYHMPTLIVGVVFALYCFDGAYQKLQNKQNRFFFRMQTGNYSIVYVAARETNRMQTHTHTQLDTTTIVSITTRPTL